MQLWFGAWYHLLVGALTLIVCLVSRYVLKGVYKNLNILVGLIFGYILSIIFTVAGIAPMVDFSGIQGTIDQVGFFSIPKLVFFTSHKPVFNLGAFLTIAIVFLVSAAETTGATTAVCTVMMFGSIMYEGIKMLKNCEFNDRTMIIVSLLLSLLLPKKKQAN